MRDFIKFDIQMFANMNTNVTTQTGTGTDLSPEMKTFYDRSLLEEAKPNLVHQQFGQKRPIPKGAGKTIEFRKFSALPKATTALTEGVTPDGRKMNVTAITATVAQYGDYIVQSDVLELTAIDNTIVEATQLLGVQAGLTLDTIVRNAMQAGTNVSYAPKVTSTGKTEVTARKDLDETAKLTVEVVERMVAKLRSNNVPKINGDYIAIVHPNVVFDLRRDPEWIEAHKYAEPENLYNGEVGKIAGVRFVESTEAKIVKDSTSNKYVYCCLFFGDKAYGVTEVAGGGLQTIIKQKGSAGTADPLDQRSSIGWKAMLTAKILVPENIIRLECCSAIATSAEN